MKIDRIINDTYVSEEGIIFSPTVGTEIVYTISISTLVDIEVDVFRVSFINSKTGFKYKLIPSNIEKINSKSYSLSFLVDQQSTERAEIDFLELIVETSSDIFNIKKAIKIVDVKKISRSFKYEKGSLVNFETNLMSVRNRIGMAKWSNGYTNTYSNTSKMLESLNSVFTSVYTKSNDYLKQAYSNTTNLTYSRCKLLQKPIGVLRGDTELIESTNLSNSLFNLNIKSIDQLESMVTVVLEKYSDNKEEIDELNKYVPSYLYIKNDGSNNSKSFVCIIEGYDEYDNYIKESLIIRTDIYVKTKSKFYKIKSISNKGLSIVVSNYVELNTNHYVDNHSFIIPSILNKDNLTFKPNIRNRSNLSGTSNLLHVYNYTSDTVTEEIKFNIGKVGDHLTSSYVTDNLDFIYTFIRDNKNYIAYSKLYLDYTKDLYNNSISNSSSILSVSDTSTSIDDWVDISVEISEWISKVKDTSFIIQIRNENKIYYYDIDSRSLKEDKTINYYQETYTDINFSLFVENNNPYTITLMTSDLKYKITSSSTCNSIDNFFEKEIESNLSLLLKEDILYLAEKKTEGLITKLSEDYQLIIENPNNTKLFYNIGIDGYEISSEGSTLSPELYSYISNIEEDTLPIVISLNSTLLNKGYLRIGLGITANYGVLPLVLKNIKVTLKKGSIEKYISITPIIIEEIVDKYGYKINMSDIEEGFINDN